MTRLYASAVRFTIQNISPLPRAPPNVRINPAPRSAARSMAALASAMDLSKSAGSSAANFAPVATQAIFKPASSIFARAASRSAAGMSSSKPEACPHPARGSNPSNPWRCMPSIICSIDQSGHTLVIVPNRIIICSFPVSVLFSKYRCLT